MLLHCITVHHVITCHLAPCFHDTLYCVSLCSVMSHFATWQLLHHGVLCNIRRIVIDTDSLFASEPLNGCQSAMHPYRISQCCATWTSCPGAHHRQRASERQSCTRYHDNRIYPAACWLLTGTCWESLRLASCIDCKSCQTMHHKHRFGPSPVQWLHKVGLM